MRKRKRNLYLVGRNKPNTLGLRRDRVHRIVVVRVYGKALSTALDALPATMMNMAEIRAHNMKEAKHIYLQMEELREEIAKSYDRG